MPVLVNTISKEKTFIHLIEQALAETPTVKHKLSVTGQWKVHQKPADIFLTDSVTAFGNVVAHYSGYRNNYIEDPIVIFIADKETISEAVVSNACNPLTIQYLDQQGADPKSLHKCISHAARLTRNRRTLKSDQRHYKSLFEHVLNPAFILNQNWEFLKVNPAFDEYFSSAKPRLVRTRFEEILKEPDDFERIFHELEMQPDQVINKEILLNSDSRTKGSLVRLQLVAIRENTGDEEHEKYEITGYNGSFQDVTEQKFMEDLQMRIDNLALTYRLARRLAHEIRNPLTNVTLALDQLKTEMGASAENGSEVYFQIINRSVKRIGDLLGQLLQGAEPKHLHLQETDIVTLIRETLRSNRDLFDLHHITLKQQFEPDMFWIYLDKDKFRRVIFHLIDNAVEAIGPKANGEITVGSYIEDNQFVVYVQDNGVGIPEDVKAKLFTPFFTSKNKGIGFGLTSTQSILAEHRALVDVKSEQGKGTTFSIGFPLSADRKTGT